MRLVLKQSICIYGHYFVEGQTLGYPSIESLAKDTNRNLISVLFVNDVFKFKGVIPWEDVRFVQEDLKDGN